MIVFGVVADTGLILCRQSSQKPSDELFERFRQSFPGVRGGSTSASNDSQTQTAGLDDSIIGQPRQVSRISCSEYSLSFVICLLSLLSPHNLLGQDVRRTGGRLEFRYSPLTQFSNWR